MNFDRLLDNFDRESRQQDQVALIFYYLEQYEEEDEVTQSDVKEVISRSRSSISPSSVSTYFSRLRDDNYVTSTENGCYRLTHSGEDQVEELLRENALNNHRDNGDLFIDTDAVDDERYEKLIADINGSYRYRIHSATMVLSRKLFEDMVFEILKTHYAGDDVHMFYNQENDCHYSFNKLLNNLKDGVPTLRRYSRELDDALVEKVRDLKNAGNKGAHSIRVEFTDDQIEEWSSDATRLAEVLYDVLLGARIADED